MAADTTKKHFIRIRGANVNNLKNLSVDIPRDKFVVFTGLSTVKYCRGRDNITRGSTPVVLIHY